MANQSSSPAANALLQLAAGHRMTAVIRAAVKLGIADLLFDGAKTAAELARETQTHEPSLARLMRGLVTMAICSEMPDGRFTLTDVGIYLAAKTERSLKPWVLLETEMLRPGWAELVESIRTGRTAGELAGLGQEQFEQIAKTRNAALFNDAMVSMTRMTIPEMLAAYDFHGITKLMDVGGGLGELISAILAKYPSMRGVVFDLPHCGEGAKKTFAAAGLGDRCEFIGGNFFESVPEGAEAIVMKSIIHDWNDERCVRILQNCRRALKPGDPLLLIERVLPEKLEARADDLYVVLDDLNMLRGPGGSERTPGELRALLAKGGFRMGRVVPTGRYSVVESTAE